MRTFGLVIILIGVMIIFLGWQNKVTPAFQALFGLQPAQPKSPAQQDATNILTGVEQSTGPFGWILGQGVNKLFPTQ